MSQPVPSYIVIISVPGPVDHEGLPSYVFQFYKPPESAVKALIPVITHNKYRTFRYLGGTKVITGLHGSGNYEVISIDAVAVIVRFSVNQYFLVPYLYYVSCNSDGSFDKILRSVHWIYKYDYISTFRFFYWNDGFSQKGDFYAIDKFADKDMITYKERVFH